MESLPPDGPAPTRLVPRRPRWTPVWAATGVAAGVLVAQVTAAGIPSELGLAAGAVLSLLSFPVLRLAQRDAQRNDGLAWAYGALVILLAGVGYGVVGGYALPSTMAVPSGWGALVVLAGTVLAFLVAVAVARAAALIVNRRTGAAADTRSTAGLGTVVSALAETVALAAAVLLWWPLGAPAWVAVPVSLALWPALAAVLAWILATDLEVPQKPEPARTS